MQKTDLIETIKKYHLGGLTNQIKYKVQDGNLVAQANSNGFFSYVEANVELEDGEFGIISTDKLLSLLSALDSELTVKYEIIQNKPFFSIADKSMQASYMLGDLTAIDSFYRAGQDSKILEFDKVPQPDFQVEIQVKKDWTDKLFKAKRALSDAKMLGFNLVGNELEFTVNYSKSINSQITFKVPAKIDVPLDLQVHNIDLIVAILTANQDYKTATLKISDIGLVLFEFVSDSYISKYLVKSLEL